MSTPLRPVADHQRHVTELLARPGAWPTEQVPLDEARGRVLATAVTASEQLPAFDNSGMDGYAVRAAEVADATSEQPVRLPVAGDVPAGAPVGELAPGTTVRIMTGAPVPRGADAVVEVEVTDGGTETVTITAARQEGSFVRPAGGDVAVGDDGDGAGEDCRTDPPGDKARGRHRLVAVRLVHGAILSSQFE